MNGPGRSTFAALGLVALVATSCKGTQKKTDAVADPGASAPTAPQLPPSSSTTTFGYAFDPVSPPPLPADLHAVDPIALLAVAHASAPPGSTLKELYVRYVGSTGLVDLGATTYQPMIRYTFSRPPIPAKQAPNAPLGVLTPAKYFSDTVFLFEGSKVDVRYYDDLGGPRGKADSDPHCTIAQVWAAARAAGALVGAVATVTFPSGAGALFSRGMVWSFRIEGADPNGKDAFNAQIDDATCKVAEARELGGRL